MVDHEHINARLVDAGSAKFEQWNQQAERQLTLRQYPNQLLNCVKIIYIIKQILIKPLMNKEIKQIDKSQKRQRRKRNRYSKISLKTKLIFFRKVIHQNANFRQIAKNLGLKYSTAKTLIRNYKGTPEEKNQELMTRICEPFDHIKQTKKRCTYRYINHEKWKQQLAEASNGMKIEKQFAFTPPIQIICNNIKIQTF